MTSVSTALGVVILSGAAAAVICICSPEVGAGANEYLHRLVGVLSGVSMINNWLWGGKNKRRNAPLRTLDIDGRV